MDNVTVTDGRTEGFLRCDKFPWLLKSGRVRNPQPVNNLSSICVVFCCPQIEAGRSSEEWHIAVSPCPSKMCVVSMKWFFVGIYCHLLKGNQLVQFRGCLQIFIRVNVQADP